VPEDLEEIVQRALYKKPEDRFQTMRDMLRALQDCEESLRPSLAPLTPTAISAPFGPSVPPVGEEVFAATDAFTPNSSAPLADPQNYAPPCSVRGDTAYLDSGDDVLTTDEREALAQLRECDLGGFVAYVDLNCPFCFALHVRLSRWGLLDQLSLRMVEHATHIIDGPFGIEQEVVLADEVYALHHRAPDVDVALPPRRFCSKVANRLLYLVQQQQPAKLSALRDSLYRTLWQDGRDIGDAEVLRGVLERHELDPSLLASCTEDPPEMLNWQGAWEQANFDCCIPVLQHEPSGRVLVGLPTQRSLVEFFLGKKSRVVDSAVCYYQRRPVVLVCGRMQQMWALIESTRDRCDFVQAPSVEEALASLRSRAIPDLVLVEEAWGADGEELVSRECKARSVPWIVVAVEGSSDGEVAALTMGAAEYLSLVNKTELARMRFERVLRDRLSVERRQGEVMTDSLTGLASRRKFTRQFETEWKRASHNRTRLSLLLIDIDGFKAFNDAYGYLAGDACLQRLGSIWDVEVRRPSDLLARFGGNEFIGLFPESDVTHAAELAERLRTLVIEADIEHESSRHDGKLTVSIGLASCIPDESRSVHELFDLADEARGEAQQRGGNEVVLRTVRELAR
jgi:diguanylate cyclase (GGDEF)-like protein